MYSDDCSKCFKSSSTIVVGLQCTLLRNRHMDNAVSACVKHEISNNLRVIQQNKGLSCSLLYNKTSVQTIHEVKHVTSVYAWTILPHNGPLTITRNKFGAQ